MNELRQELPPELTEPEVRTVTGVFMAPLQSVYGTGQVPNPSGALVGQIPPSSIRIGGISRLCKILGGCVGIDVDSSEPGVDIDIISYFGIELAASVSGGANIGYELALFNPQAPGTGIEFDAQVPLKVTVKFPAYDTLAPGQEFYVDSAWRIDESQAQGRRFRFDTTEPDYFNLDTTLDFDLDFSFETTICVFGCIDIDISITLPSINFNLFNVNILPLEFCALFDDTRLEGFCPIDIDIDPCAPFVAAGLECPYISLADDPYNHYPIQGLEDVAPGAATIDVLKALEDGELLFATTGLNAPLQSRKFITSHFNYAVAGMTLDLANASAALLQLPPLNGSLSDLFAWKGSSLNPVAGKAADLFSYNMFDASVGFDFVLGHDFGLKARAPRIRLQYDDPGGQYSIDETFRAGERRLITMPDELDPGELTITVENRNPKFTTEIAALVDPRFDLSAIGASVEVPGIGELELNPLFKSGDLLPSPTPFAEIEFDALVSGSFDAAANYDLAPRTRPTYITGTVLNQPDGSNGRPRLVTNCDGQDCDPINLAIVDLTTGSNGEILIVPAGLITRNTQFIGGTFNLMLNSGTVALGETEFAGTYMVFGGSALMPGLDGTTINLALAQSANNPGASGQLQGGLEFSSNEGAYIRNSTINAAPFPDGTMLIVDNNDDFDILPPAPIEPDVTLKGRVGVYSGNNVNQSAGPEIIDLDISNSQIRAVELVIANSNPKPTIVTMDDSTLHADLDIRSANTQLFVSGNSLVTGDADPNTSNRNSGLIDVRGSQEDIGSGDETVFGVPVASSLLDTGARLSNRSSGTVTVGPGGMLSVRSGNDLVNTGQVDLEGSFDDLGSMQVMAMVAALATGYSADDLFAALVANPISDAVLLIDGGTVETQAIASSGATILGRGGSIDSSSIDSDNARLIVDGGTLGLSETELRGSGIVHVRPGSTLALTAGDLVDGEVEPVLQGQGLLISSGLGEPDVYARRTLVVANDGTLEIVPGPAPVSEVVQLRGDVGTNGFLEFRNGGDVSIAGGQFLQFWGDAAFINAGTLTIGAGGTLLFIEQSFPTTDGDGNPVVGVINPTFLQTDGRTTVNGELDLDLVSQNSMIEFAGGVLDGTGSVLAAVTNSGATVSPGNSGSPIGTLYVDQAYVQTKSGRLDITINGSGNSSLQVGDPVVLAGTLAVAMDADWWNSGSAMVGLQFQVMSHTGLTGGFDSVSVELSDGTPINDFTFDITYNPDDTVTITLAEVDERDIAEGIYNELGRFQDVSSDTFAFSFIERLGISGVSGGCGNGLFCPGDPVTRAQMAVFLERGMRGSDYVPPAATGAVFGDVAAGDFAAAFIEQLFADGITGGCGGGNYCPNAVVTRAQMAVFLLRARYGAAYVPPPATGVFADVPVGSFADRYIEQLSVEGITSGCGNGNYCPGNPVTRAQMAVFLVRTFGL